MLCGSCKSIFAVQRVPGRKLRHHDFHTFSFRGIQLSARVGCILCSQIFHRLKPSFPQNEAPLSREFWNEKHQLEYRLVEYLQHPDRFTLSVRLVGTPIPEEEGRPTSSERNETLDDPNWHRFEVGSFDDLAEYLTIAGSDYEISSSSHSDNTWDLAKQWMNICIKEHPECRSNDRPQKWYPSRLLDVGQDPGDHKLESTIQIHSPAEQNTSGDYITVSHRWGDVMPLLLSQQTLSRFKTGIFFWELPKTFADAVEVAWKFNIRYIWIDSMCITQDSQEEWRSESAKMGQVYRNSWLNIAAIDSFDCSGGCFFERDVSLVQPIEVKIGSDPRRYFCVDKNLWLGTIDDAPLSQRAWVIQERLLSPRQIHFSSLQLFWECRRTVACETLPGSIIPTMFARHGSSSSQQMKRFAADLHRLGQGHWAEEFVAHHFDQSVSTELRSTNIQSGWRLMIAVYSKCALTYPKDKLVAISGIAKAMASVINDQYLCGLWRSQLPGTLLWFTSPIGTPENFRTQKIPSSQVSMWKRSRPLRAPTWSWASVDLAVAYCFPYDQKPTDKIAIQVLEAVVEPLAGDIYGEILSGCLRVRCMLYPATVHSRNENGAYVHQLQIGDTLFENGVFLDEVPGMVETEEGLQCMPVFFRDWNGDQKAPTQVRALILKPTGKIRGQFERFGLLTDWGAQKMQVFAAPWQSVSKVNCEDDLGGGQYVISLI